MTDEQKHLVQTRTGMAVPVSGRSAYFETIEQDSAMDPTTLGGLYRLAEVFSQANLCPKAFKGDPGSIMLVLMSAKQIGIPLVSALQNAYEIGGKVGWQSVVLEALVQRSRRCKQFYLKSVDDNSAVYVVQTDRMTQPVEVAYTYSEAQRAGLAGKDNWQKNRQDMLVARCRGRAARRYFAEECMGIYSIEELRDAGLEPEATPDAPRPMKTGDDLLTALAGGTATAVVVEEEPEPRQKRQEAPEEPFGVLEGEEPGEEEFEAPEPAGEVESDPFGDQMPIGPKKAAEIRAFAAKNMGGPKRGVTLIENYALRTFNKPLEEITWEQSDKLEEWAAKALKK